MRKFPLYVAAGLCVFGAVFAALQFDRWLDRRKTAAGFEGLDKLAVSSVKFDGGTAFVDFRSAVRKVLPSIVSVDKSQRVRRFFYSDETEMRQTSTGSGVIISKDGYVLTNNHVVQDADQVTVRLGDKQSFVAKVVGADPRSDLAVLKINGSNFVAAELADSSKLEIGEWVIAIGNPLGFSNTVSVGVVSSLNRTLPTEESLLVDAIQTDAAINQGNSGGALTNAMGQVVGINSAIATPSGGSVGLGFAIPVNRAKRVVDEILKFGRVKYGWSGLRIYQNGTLANTGLRDQLAQEVGANPPDRGLVIIRVSSNSAAEKAGVKNLDVILQVDGQTMDEPIDFFKAMADKKPGDVVRLNLWSAGATKTVSVTLEDLMSL